MKINQIIAKKLAAYGLSGALILAGAGTVSFYEGKANKVYVDPVGILTSCFGHTGRELKKGQTFTDDQCLQQLAEDLVAHDNGMMKYVRVPLSDKEHAAYLSFTYNLGVNAFANSTLLKKLNKEDRVGACNELLRWDKAKGKTLAGLTKRRQDENKLCLEGVLERVDENYK
ncbi:MAG: lysozyme [Myoviridae sp. ctThM1]|nr:MAG: lysozyme [Myoviridae sp. ctThM1]